MKEGEKTASKLRAVNKIGRAPLAAARAKDCVSATIRGAENVQSWPLCKRLEDSGAWETKEDESFAKGGLRAVLMEL